MTDRDKSDVVKGGGPQNGKDFLANVGGFLKAIAFTLSSRDSGPSLQAIALLEELKKHINLEAMPAEKTLLGASIPERLGGIMELAFRRLVSGGDLVEILPDDYNYICRYIAKLIKENERLLELVASAHEMVLTWNSSSASVNDCTETMDAWQKDFEENEKYADIRAKISDMITKSKGAE